MRLDPVALARSGCGVREYLVYHGLLALLILAVELFECICDCGHLWLAGAYILKKSIVEGRPSSLVKASEFTNQVTLRLLNNRAPLLTLRRWAPLPVTNRHAFLRRKLTWIDRLCLDECRSIVVLLSRLYCLDTLSWPYICNGYLLSYNVCWRVLA